MALGRTYSGLASSMAQWGITVFEPSGGSAVPLPSTFLLMVSGLAGLAGLAGTLREEIIAACHQRAPGGVPAAPPFLLGAVAHGPLAHP